MMHVCCAMLWIAAGKIKHEIRFLRVSECRV